MTVTVTLPTLHPDQVRAFRLKVDPRAEHSADWAANGGGRFKAIRCGRRWGKTEWGKTWIGDGATKGHPCGWFAPDYKKLSEAFEELRTVLAPVVTRSSKVEGVIRTSTGGRIDFWTLLDESAGRSRKYRRIFVDEGAFTKANMMDIWKKSIKPTLFDLGGSCVVGSNTNGVAPDNFMWQICNQPEHGFIEFHAPTINNPTIPMMWDPAEEEAILAELPELRLLEPADPRRREMVRTLLRHREIAKLKAREHPLVFQQEYEADFVDWSGVAFFDRERLLENGQPVEMPEHCDYVFATIDSAVKTGSGNDGTAVTYWARNVYAGTPLTVLDWDITQIEGDLLESWMVPVFQNLELLARRCGARRGSVGAHIEDKATGMVLIMALQRKGLPAHAIPSVLTSVGKDERAVAVSGYHHRGEVKISREAYDKTTVYKQQSANHFFNQVCGFRIGVKDQADDLLDTYTYGLSIALGDGEGI